MYGIKGSALNWFQSYLTNRTQQVQYDQTISSRMENNYGVPQGSVLGPILFILYINDVIQELKNCGCFVKLFADDMIVYVYSDDLTVIEERLNNCLKKLLLWLRRNSLMINTDKTVFMPIHDPRKLNVRDQ